ncbi:MAG: hypothetical protein Udaeo2_21860 [Candidatus Udaeobacter sp.]|nr:MAG: hypothetical protein Udaeo2_21860 [Candidatus Udaeobacter sp.]
MGNTATNRRVRKPLNHSAHFYGRFGASYFVTICCQRRGVNQLSVKDVASILFETARRYHTSRRWYLKLLLLMPDHLHMLIGVPGDGQLSNLIRDFKRITTRIGGIDGSGIFSIVVCDMTRARMRKWHTFVRILFAVD